MSSPLEPSEPPLVDGEPLEPHLTNDECQILFGLPCAEVSRECRERVLAMLRAGRKEHVSMSWEFVVVRPEANADLAWLDHLN